MLDERELRNALARYPTGVAVVTGRSPDGVIKGLTVNSVAGVALSPGRMLWSLGVHSGSRPFFDAAPFFAINVLEENQLPLAKRMASKVEDRFADISWRASGHSGVPLLDGCLAWFECRRISNARVGDHVLFIGDIVDFWEGAGAPLLFHSGRYSRVEKCAEARL